LTVSAERGSASRQCSPTSTPVAAAEEAANDSNDDFDIQEVDEGEEERNKRSQGEGE